MRSPLRHDGVEALTNASVQAKARITEALQIRAQAEPRTKNPEPGGSAREVSTRFETSPDGEHSRR
jgi:hypothetical protein